MISQAGGITPQDIPVSSGRAGSLQGGTIGKTLLLRAKAEEAFVKADCAVKLPKLQNTVARACPSNNHLRLPSLDPWRCCGEPVFDMLAGLVL